MRNFAAVLFWGKESSMIASTGSLRVGIFGPEEIPGNESRGCALWETGYAAAVRMAGGEPVMLGETAASRHWWTDLEGVHALIWAGRSRATLQCEKGDCPSILKGTVPFFAQPLPEETRLCNWCRKNRFPILAVD